MLDTKEHITIINKAIKDKYRKYIYNFNYCKNKGVFNLLCNDTISIILNFLYIEIEKDFSNKELVYYFKQLTGNKSLLSFLIIYDFGLNEENDIQITYYPSDYWNDVYNLSFDRIDGWKKKIFNTITRILRADNFVITNKEMKQLEKIELCLEN